MIADIACWERGCACHSASGNGDDGVEVQLKKEWVNLTLKKREMLRDEYGDDPSGLISIVQMMLKENNDN